MTREAAGARERFARRLMWVRWLIIAGAVLGLIPLVAVDLMRELGL